MRTTVIIPTTGDEITDEAVCSVINQTVKCKLLVVLDGEEAYFNSIKIFSGIKRPNTKFLTLPENVGANGWYGHRVYASVPMLVNTEFVAFLDQDNYFEPDFIEKMETAMDRHGKDIVTCRRKVVSQSGLLIGYDNIESVGANKLGYNLFDTSTYLIRQSIAHKVCPAIYGKWGADRPFTDACIAHGLVHLRNYYGLNYRAPERLYEHFETICTKEMK
jgi:cellulose synthase/poly-beta-1,6-N-acetylglucosamine synthase-like glycosyltransferase